jgi:Trypsin-co-occurring domain 2
MELKIADLMSAIRNELDKVEEQRVAAKRIPAFRLAELTLELQFVVEQKKKADGGFDIKVVSVGAGSSLRNEEVQKVIIKYSTTDRVQLFAAGEPSPQQKELNKLIQ